MLLGRGVGMVFLPVRSIDPLIEIRIRLFYKTDILVYPSVADVALVLGLYPAKPGPGAPIDRAHVQIIADTHHPDDHWFSQCAIGSDGCNLQLFRFSYLIKLF